jgi:hypothetical protein
MLVRFLPTLMLFCLAVTCPDFEYILVIYLTTIVLRAIELISDNSVQKLIHTINATQVAHVTFSLLINIYATSVIALKAWCVIVDGTLKKYIVDFALMGGMTRALHTGNTASC